MVFEKLKDINRGLCKDSCDNAGYTGNYSFALTYAILIDIIFPIAFFFIGITFSLVGFLASLVIPGVGGVLLGIVGIIIFLITIGIVIIVGYLLYKEIGVLILIPIAALGTMIILSVIPVTGFIAFGISLVPWSIVAVLIHYIAYRDIGLSKKTM